ncbi:restriction endonuclease subunit S, partial [Pseudomonas aeruginosa]|nr:restriction endonuclease subunit S [Pseudomonas aeruginosa]
DSCRLADIADVQGGYAFKSADFGSAGVAVVKIANIQPPNVTLDSADRVEQHKLEGLARFELADGDILMAMTGATVGKVARFRKTERAFLNQRVARISAKGGPEFNDFIYALVSLPGFDKQIENAAAGSAQANISAAGIGAVAIPSLGRDAQLVIGSIARSIDDRITLLRETNTTLEAIAQSLFKSWFVDFDPVRAKAEGRQPEGMDAATATLFPDSFEETELGLVPKGWEVKTVGDVVNVTDYVANGSFAALKENVTLLDQRSYALYVRTTDHNSGFSGGFRYVDKAAYEFLSKSSLLGNEVIISNVGDVGTVFRPPRWLGIPMTLGSNAVALKAPRMSAFLFFHFSGAKGQHDIHSVVTGSAQLKFNKTNFRSLKLLLPNESCLSEFEEKASLLLEASDNNRAKIETLTQLRDTLLPRLISGQLRLPEAQAMVENAYVV